MKQRLRRSELAVPAINEHMIEKASKSEADLVFLDLEDATAPDKKAQARGVAIRALNELDWSGKVRAVRVNDHNSEWVVDDLVSILEGAGANIDVLILPKIKEPRDVWFFETMVSSLEARLGLRKQIGFEVLIEEAMAMGNVEAIAGSSSRLEAMILGFGDLAASMGMRFDHELDPSLRYPGDPWNAHRVRMIAACRAANIDAIDGPFGNYEDHQGYREQATYATTLGAVGKWCIHPNQIPHANEVFAPTKAEIEIAQRMVDAYQRSLETGSGAGQAGGTLVDAATLRLYQPVLERARLIGQL